MEKKRKIIQREHESELSLSDGVMATGGSVAGGPAARVLPVFLREKDIPRAGITPVSVLEICTAAERVTGLRTIEGAQWINFQWRIYPLTRKARDDLLIQGIVLRDTQLKVSAENCFIIRDAATGDDKPSTKVWIDSVPLSVDDKEIEQSLLSLKCELRTDIKRERARNVDGKMTRFLTGRRFVFITTPATPLEKTMKVCDMFTAKVFHWEQKSLKKKLVCSNCLEENHHHSTCDKPVVCKVCKQPGHKRGSPECGVNMHGQNDDDRSGRDLSDFSDLHAEAVLSTPPARSPSPPPTPPLVPPLIPPT